MEVHGGKLIDLAQRWKLKLERRDCEEKRCLWKPEPLQGGGMSCRAGGRHQAGVHTRCAEMPGPTCASGGPVTVDTTHGLRQRAFFKKAK